MIVKCDRPVKDCQLSVMVTDVLTNRAEVIIRVE